MKPSQKWSFTVQISKAKTILSAKKSVNSQNTIFDKKSEKEF